MSIYARAISAALFAGQALGVPHAAAQEWDEWRWRAPIEGVPEGAEFVQLPLPLEIVDRARPNLADLRVVSIRGEAVPHVIDRPATPPSDTWESIAVRNRVGVPGSHAQATAAFGARISRSRLRVALSGTNYRRYAVLEASEDEEEWSLADARWLFNLDENGEHFSLNTFHFPANNMPFMRVTVYNMEDEPEMVRIGKIEMVRHAAVRDWPVADAGATVHAVEPDEDEPGTALYDIDLGHANLDIETLRIAPGDTFFHRGYIVYARAAPTRTVERMGPAGPRDVEEEVPWAVIQRGVFYRIQHEPLHGEAEISERLSTGRLATGHRYLRLKIHSGDDAPLALEPEGIQVDRKAPPRLIVEAAGRAVPAALLYGNAKAAAPRYDLAKSIEGLAQGEWSEATLGPAIEQSPEEPERSLFERYEGLVWVVFVITVAVMVRLILRNLRFVRRD